MPREIPSKHKFAIDQAPVDEQGATVLPPSEAPLISAATPVQPATPTCVTPITSWLDVFIENNDKGHIPASARLQRARAKFKEQPDIQAAYNRYRNSIQPRYAEAQTHMKGGSLNEEDRAVMDLVRLNEYIGKLVEEATREGHVDDLVKQNPDPGPVAPHMPFPTRRQRSPIPSRIALTGSRTASVYSPSSRFWRYATSETLIGSIGAAGFGAFLYATKNFQNMSLGLDRFCKDILNIHAPSLSQYAIAAIYAVSMASVLLITGIRTSRQVAAKAQLLHELDNASEDIKGMRRYVRGRSMLLRRELQIPKSSPPHWRMR